MTRPVGQAGQPESLLGWMDSLADATRLRLLHLLEHNELGVAELCEVLQLPQSTVSRHLKVLADQNWLTSRRQGTNNLYRAWPDELDPAAGQLWAVAREQTRDWATLAQDQLRLERLLREKLLSKQNDSQAFFAGAAGQWDKLRGELYGQRFTQLALLALLPADYVVADLGCGTGQVAEMLAPHVGRVIGVDNSPAMLKAASRRLGNGLPDLPAIPDGPPTEANGVEANLGAGNGNAMTTCNVELRLGNLDAVPIESASCDAALLLLVLTYLPEPAAALRETARILKPGGRAVVVDLLPHDRDDFRREMEQRWLGFEPADVKAWLADVGMASVCCRPIAPEPQAKGPALFMATGVQNGM